MVLGAVLMGWRWDEFGYQAIRITGHSDLPTNVHIEEPSQIPWSQARWLGDIEDPRLNESSGLAASNCYRCSVVDKRQR